jgi:hypothetical protein
MMGHFAFGPRTIPAVIFGAAAFAAFAAPASAATCAPREEFVKALASQFNEKPIGMGLAGSGAMVVLFVSPAGTWTAATVSTTGSACLVGSGNNWTDVAPPVGAMAQSESTPSR